MRGVFLEIAEDVGQLQRDAAGPGRTDGLLPAKAPDVDAGQPHRRGHAMAINGQLVERLVAVGIQVHLHPVDDRVEMLLGDAEAADRVGHGRQDGRVGPLALWERARVRGLGGVGGFLARRYSVSGRPHPLPLSRRRERGDRCPLPLLGKRERGDAAPRLSLAVQRVLEAGPPLGKGLAAAVSRRGAVAQVVGMAHEGVEGLHGAALGLPEHEEAGGEARPGPACDAVAGGVAGSDRFRPDGHDLALVSSPRRSFHQVPSTSPSFCQRDRRGRELKTS